MQVSASVCVYTHIYFSVAYTPLACRLRICIDIHQSLFGQRSKYICRSLPEYACLHIYVSVAHTPFPSRLRIRIDLHQSLLGYRSQYIFDPTYPQHSSANSPKRPVYSQKSPTYPQHSCVFSKEPEICRSLPGYASIYIYRSLLHTRRSHVVFESVQIYISFCSDIGPNKNIYVQFKENSTFWRRIGGFVICHCHGNQGP